MLFSFFIQRACSGVGNGGLTEKKMQKHGRLRLSGETQARSWSMKIQEVKLSRSEEFIDVEVGHCVCRLDLAVAGHVIAC